MLQALLEQNQQTQQVLEQERRERELESKDVSQKITQICNAIEQQQRLLATNQQTIKNELMQEVAKKMECGVPSEVKKEPPGLSLGRDDRGRCVKSEPPNERTEEEGPEENYCPIETDPQKTEKVRDGEMQKFYLEQWTDWAKWFETQPETYEWGELPKTTWGLPNGKGKGQGSKGGPYPKTDPGGIDF